MKASDGCLGFLAIIVIPTCIAPLVLIHIHGGPPWAEWVHSPNDEIGTATTLLSDLHKECVFRMVAYETNSDISELLQKDSLKHRKDDLKYSRVLDYETGKPLDAGKKCSDSIVLIKAPVDRYQNLGFAIKTGQGNKYCITRQGESMKGWSCQ